jgi:hypothetical protein
MVDFKSYYTDEKVAALSKAFDLVKDPEHWKGPVNGYVTVDVLDDVKESVAFYTGTIAEAVVVSGGPYWGLYHVRAAGYWAGPAGG